MGKNTFGPLVRAHHCFVKQSQVYMEKKKSILWRFIGLRIDKEMIKLSSQANCLENNAN